MKIRKPMRKISAKRMQELTSSGLRLGFNSTIARKPCTAITAVENSNAENYLGIVENYDSVSAKASLTVAQHVIRNSKVIFGSRHKPISKQSKKQKARLQGLAAIRERWWQEAQASGKPLNCGICDEEIRTREELASDHIEPGHGKSDSETNLQPAHVICNGIKASRRNFKIVRGDKKWRLIHGSL